MAGVRGHLPFDDVPLSAGVPKTVVQITAAANHRLLIKNILVAFKSISSSDEPVEVILMRQTSAGTGGVSATIAKNNESDDETIQATGQTGPAGAWTTEPTAGDILQVWRVHPQPGLAIFYPFGEEIVVKGGSRLGLKMTAAQAQSASGAIIFEE